MNQHTTFVADWKTGDIITVQLGEHTWRLPPIPQKKDILFSELPKENQFWRRQTDFPDEFLGYGPLTKINAEYTQWEGDVLMSLSVEDTIKVAHLQDREVYRRKHGIWFMNNGKPEYLTGDNYFLLQWFRMANVKNQFDNNQPYGGFRRFQQHVFFFIQMCVENDRCLGGYIVKPKKTGVSMLFSARALNISTMTPEWEIGMMSKSHDDCKAALFKYFKYGLDWLPYIFKPNIKTDNLDEIEFGNPRVKNTGSKKSQMRQMENGQGFNTKIKAAPTKADAFDGPVMNEVYLDEISKCEGPYPEEIFEKTSKTVKLGELLNGKLFLFNYVNETDGKGFEQGRKIYYDSKLNTVDSVTLTTKSELFAYAISAADSLETIDNRFDKYGEVDTKKNYAFINNRREQFKNDRQGLQGYMRKFPLNEEECWRFGGAGGSAFDNIRLGKRAHDLNEQLKLGALPYIDGYLVWSGARLDSEVRFVRTSEQEKLDGKEGKIRIYGLKTLTEGPLQQRGVFNQPFLRKNRDDLKRYKPLISTPTIAATDPTDYALKSDVTEGSRNGITAMTFPDVATDTYFGSTVTGRGVLRYLYRPENPLEYYEDLLMIVWWLGCYILVEANKPWVITKMKEDNMHNFLLVRTDKGIVPYNEYEHTRLTHATKYTIDEMVRTFNIFYAPPAEGEFDRMELLEDEEELSQLMRFDVTDTKKFDLAVCKLHNIVALESFSAWRLKESQKESLYSGTDMSAILNKILY